MIIIILTGFFVAASCGLLGNFLILRKMAMIGDAISHAVLPGIVIAFMFSGNRDTMAIFFGAVFFGLICTLVIEYLTSKVKLQSDASIGITFTFLFAIGIILISAYTRQVDLDLDCVLYGEIGYLPLDSWINPYGYILPSPIVFQTGFTLLFVALFVVIGFKQLYLTTFDPDYANTLGVKTQLWHYALMAVVSMTTVASFEAVGAFLVLAFLIVPPATAYLLSEDFKKMLVITLVLDLVISIFGYILSSYIDGSIAGAMATVSGMIFGTVLVVQLLMKNKKFSIHSTKEN